MQNPSWSAGKPPYQPYQPYQPQAAPSGSQAGNAEEVPPSYAYAPPPYPPHNYLPPSGSPTAGPGPGPGSAAYGNPNPNPDWQYQWQQPSPSPSSSRPVPPPPSSKWQPGPPPPTFRPVPQTPTEIFPPPLNPSSSIVRPLSAPPPSGSNSHNLKRDPLNPPPPSFSRPVAPHPPLPPFPPLTLSSNDTSLDKGFPIILPMPLYPGPAGPNSYPYQQQGFVHPFAQRDVLEADWTRLLEDIYLTAKLSGTQKIAANVVPLAAGVSLLGGIFLTKGIEKRMKKKNSEPAGDLVDVWNQHFFHARGLHVILAHGPENLSGEIDGPAPDWVGAGSGRGRGRSADSDSDSSSEDDSRRRRRGGGGGSGGLASLAGGLAGGLQGKLEARLAGRSGGGRRRGRDRGGEREEKREERKSHRAARKAEKYERYRLVVVPI